MSCRLSPVHSKSRQFTNAAVSSEGTPWLRGRVNTKTCRAIVAMAKRPMPFSPSTGLSFIPATGDGFPDAFSSSLFSVAIVSQRSTNSSVVIPTPSSRNTKSPSLR